MTEPAPKFEEFEQWGVSPVPEHLKRKRLRKSARPNNDNGPQPEKVAEQQPSLNDKASLKRIRKLRFSYREEVYDYPPDTGLSRAFSTFLRLAISGSMMVATGPANHPSSPIPTPSPPAIDILDWGAPTITRFD